jgi:hypothetical protein
MTFSIIMTRLTRTLQFGRFITNKTSAKNKWREKIKNEFHNKKNLGAHFINRENT